MIVSILQDIIKIKCLEVIQVSFNGNATAVVS